MNLVLSYIFFRGWLVARKYQKHNFHSKKGQKVIFLDIGENKLLIKNINYESQSFSKQFDTNILKNGQ